MKEYVSKTLDVKRLLAMGDLDIRGIAEREEELSAAEYFARVDNFIENAAQLRSTLSSVSKLEENMRTLKELEAKLGVAEREVGFSADNKILGELENLKEVLIGIGFEKMNFDIDGILNSIKSDNLQLAEKIAAGALGTFDTLHERIKSTVIARKFAGARGKGDDNPDGAVSLSDAVAYLDYQEENRKLRVLAVDDVSVILHTITSVLSPYYEVFALKSSSQVVKFLETTTPELFLLDIEMNEINGFDLVPLIRRFDEHKDTPIIFLTGNTSFSNLKDAIALGACDFIAKPIDREILLEKIGKNIVKKNIKPSF